MYDGDGVRARKTVGASPTLYHVHDTNRALPALLVEYDAAGNVIRKYVWGFGLGPELGLAYNVVPSGAVEVYHHDHLGNTRELTDDQGHVKQIYGTDEYGAPTIVDPPIGNPGSSLQPLRYTGEHFDAETGFVYLRARHYEPGTGRFVQRDPLAGGIGARASLNSYIYSGNNPTTYADPSGECLPFCLGVVPIIWAAAEAGLTVWDAVSTLQTLTNPDASELEKTASIGLFFAGVIGPGGGYSAVGTAALKAVDLKLTQTVARHLDDVTRTGAKARPYIDSRLLIQEIMDAAPPTPDPGGVAGALRWDVAGSFNGTAGTWELVVDTSTNTVLHFLFKGGP